MDRISEQHHIQHLFWRAAFGATPEVMQRESRKPIRKVVRDLLQESRSFTPLLVIDPDQLVDKKLLKELFRGGMVDREAVKQKIKQGTELIRDLNVLWVEKMASCQQALREKMALFWHGHFACRVRNPGAVQHYVNTLRQHALGNFGELLMAVSKEPAMLQFLNNQQNRKNAPNENFARELMELFTLGRGNYTEKDIKDAARAFTGWGFNAEGTFVFRQFQHDDGPKTIFGQTGTFAGDDVISLLLQQKQTAQFVTGKLYRFLVNEQDTDAATTQRINTLADRFYGSGYDIADLLETILTADWFYDPANIGTRIKSPVELVAGMQHTLGIRFKQKQSVVFIQRTLGQVLLYPPNVAGWPGGRNWIDSSSLLFRMKLPEVLLQAAQVTTKPKDDGDVNTELLSRRGKGAMNATVSWMAFEQSFKKVPAERLPDELAAYLLQQPLGDGQRSIVVQRVRPESSLSEQLQTLTAALMALPEYQMC
ncbi:DUF1800 domain-containing protein [Spirosoma utsteinense]|uniref:DUF1800 domain-containing protein n=1 Tax=Spirosoma utsteinense TaxID=2585773 RepID=A0ABR6WE48_9BACT|nr:DUF1800 domain-containing protein [Spirosoma utsteinense]MBC3788866.1 putative protein (DUF1800 family) [Spirosoma utsteinense]MBC3794807.1 putative protein (DUF1800 family) [Spirosoma utsteinense]